MFVPTKDGAMAPLYATALLRDILVGLACSVIIWAALRRYSQSQGYSPMAAFDRLLFAFGMLAAFALGLFLAYMILSISGPLRVP